MLRHSRPISLLLYPDSELVSLEYDFSLFSFSFYIRGDGFIPLQIILANVDETLASSGTVLF